ncbi:glycosyltransferase family 2 protein [Gordonia sp. NB41Y]|uniref:glycosyltransferase family 2 protein n=1 Tax=Gordonia sp. NB41Y TaxID=875808 RepID=UPI0002BFF6F0|nr:glycosyltransferase family 2 protein [Gordonia sp. NB41Y]WLP90944.1 glycosyltransferase family 2 protein [Gordonia sp. NB41Y]
MYDHARSTVTGLHGISAVPSADSGKPRPSVSVIIPAMNEAKNLPYVAYRMPLGIDQIVFVDGHSADDTVAVARKLWPDATFVTQTRSGKGNALACGIEACTGDIIVMIDADGSTDPAEIPLFVQALLDGADLAKGSRFVGAGGSTDITTLRRWGNKALNQIVNTYFHTKFTDLCYGYNAFWARHAEQIELPPTHYTRAQWGDGFEIETVINVRLATAGLKISEVGSFEGPRLHGRSNLNAYSDGMRVLRTINQEFAHWKDHRSKVRSGVRAGAAVEKAADELAG